MPEVEIYLTQAELDLLGINNADDAGLIVREMLGLPCEGDIFMTDKQPPPESAD